MQERLFDKHGSEICICLTCGNTNLGTLCVNRERYRQKYNSSFNYCLQIKNALSLTECDFYSQIFFIIRVTSLNLKKTAKLLLFVDTQGVRCTASSSSCFFVLFSFFDLFYIKVQIQIWVSLYCHLYVVGQGVLFFFGRLFHSSTISCIVFNLD